MGLPKHLLSVAELEELRLGNYFALRTAELAEHCIQARCAFAIENPAPEVQAAPPPYRDCDNVKGYNYRQYADGKIEIRSGGLASSTQEGTRVGSQYQAAVTASIEAKCGPYPAGTTTTQDSVWASTLSSLGIDSGGSSASGGTQRGAAIGAGIGAFGAQLLPSLAAMLGPQETTIYDDEAPEMDVGGGGGAPWGLILGGVAVLGVLGVLGAKLAFSSTKDDDEE